MTPQQAIERIESALMHGPYDGRWKYISATFDYEEPLLRACNPSSISLVLEYVRELEKKISTIREECAQICERRYMGDNNREDMEARRCAAAIRAGIEGKEKT